MDDRHVKQSGGQGLVEFALILPVFFLAMLAVLEIGWYAIVQAANTTASREAARYAATIGMADGSEHYIDCAGIRAAAYAKTNPVITAGNSTISVTYDDGTGTAAAQPCTSTASRPAASDIQPFDRVVVTVTHAYGPITPLVAPIWGQQTLVSTDRRSIPKPDDA